MRKMERTTVMSRFMDRKTMRWRRISLKITIRKAWTITVENSRMTKVSLNTVTRRDRISTEEQQRK